jgi:spore germination protein GerM
VKRPATSTLIILGAALVLVMIAVVRLAMLSPQDSAVEPAAGAEAGDTDRVDVAPDPDSVDDVMRRLNVLVYFPSTTGDGLVGEAHEIFMTAAPGDRAKQILADLISGPMTKTALRALPPGTQLRQVYVLEQGTAYVDFSADLKRGIGGGSTEELFTVYSIINSVALNIPEIRRVGILVEGQPVDTLNGHLDLRRPLPPDPSVIVRETERRIVRADAYNPAA